MNDGQAFRERKGEERNPRYSDADKCYIMSNITEGTGKKIDPSTKDTSMSSPFHYQTISAAASGVHEKS